MGSSWLGSGHAPPPPPPGGRPYKRGRSPECSLAFRSAAGNRGSIPLAPRDRRWYNPNRKRRWASQWVEADNASALSSSRDRFVILSYNILGDSNALNHPNLYLNTPYYVMKWDSRKEVLHREISEWNADIVCLQEVDRYNEVLCNMKKNGYLGSFKGRTGEAKDGCAIFWKEKRFHLLEEDYIEFSAFDLRDNVAQLLVFEMCQLGSRRFVVGNIHVLFNPKRGDIKLGQIGMLLKKAHALSVKWGDIPVVLAGDFNSTPQSAVYEFLSTSELNITLHDRRSLSGQDLCDPSPCDISRLLNYSWTDEELKNATGSSHCKQLINPLKLRSSYASIKASTRTRGPSDEPLATSYHSKFLGTVDYIWYSTGLASAKVLETLPLDILRKIGGLPTKDIGSDHLALVSEFVFTECTKSESHKTTEVTTEATEETTIPEANTSCNIQISSTLRSKGRKRKKSNVGMNPNDSRLPTGQPNC